MTGSTKVYLACGAALTGAAAYTVGAQVWAAGLRRGVVFCGPARPMVALTFDDGPDPVHTPRVLDILGEHGAQATFFVVGRQVEAAPALVRAIAAAGHDLGNHTYSHCHLWTLPPRASVEEVDRGAASVAQATGTPPPYFRPPWGTFNWAAYSRAAEIGEVRVLWSVRPEGWLRPASPAELAAFVVRRAHPGAIVNLHDRGGHPSTPAATCEALPAIIAGLRARGFDLVPLRTLLENP